MTNGVFIKFGKLKKGENGQIAAFLIVMLVILLVAAISLINVGKVSLHKMYTANAADAGAIAGAVAIAGIANTVARGNLWMIARFLAIKLIIQGSLWGVPNPKSCGRSLLGFMGLGLCKMTPCPRQLSDFLYYIDVVIRQLFLGYLFLQIQAWDGFNTARAQAHRTAFANAGIEEPKRRDRATGEILQPRFSQWLNGLAVTDPDVPSPRDMRDRTYTFRWYSYSIDIATGREARERPEPNEVTSRVEMNDCGLVLVPAPDQTLRGLYEFEVTGIRANPKAFCYPCACETDASCPPIDMQAWSNWLTRIIPIENTIAKFGYFITKIVPFANGFRCFRWQTQLLLVSQIVTTLLQLIWGKDAVSVEFAWPPSNFCSKPKWRCDCGNPLLAEAKDRGRAMIRYLVPVPFLLGIANIDPPWLYTNYFGEHIRVTCTVSYYEPAKNFGFWQRRGTRVSSSAVGEVKCGFTGGIGCFAVPGHYIGELAD